MNESENQLSFTRAATSTSGRASANSCYQSHHPNPKAGFCSTSGGTTYRHLGAPTAAALLLVIFLIVLTSSVSGATTYSSHYGVCGAWAGEPFDSLVDSLGVTWIRTGFDWDVMETADDYYDPYAVWLQDNMFSAMTSRGINVFHNFNYTPAWARSGGDQRTPPSNPAKYTEYITWAVNRWKNQCHHWGFWNEVNIAPFWTGDYNWYIQNLLIPGIDAVKAADPTAKTVVGELSTAGDDVGKLRTMLRAIVAAGRKDKVDIISHHSYDGGDTWQGRVADIDTLHNMLVAEGFGDRELWITESGIDDPDRTRQATFVVGMAAAMDTRPWWTKFFYWQFHEGVGDNFGLVAYPDWSPKPAYTQYQSLIADHADSANILSNTIPATMVAGRQYSVSVTVKNEGTVDWPESQGYKLGAVNDSDPFAGTRHYLNTGETVATDATRTFWFQMTAPRTPGTYTTDWRMVREGVRWFGHSLVKQIVVNPPVVSLGFLGPAPALTISGAAGDSYVIQSSPDLGNTNAWVTLTNLTLTQPEQLWVDTNADASLPANLHRFYRFLPGQ